MNTPHDDSFGIAPSLRELIALRDVARHAGAQRMAAAASLPGSHASSRFSRGMEFAEARPYRPGDDIRSIDWRQTARRGKPYTKLFREEHERPVSLLVDLGPTMRFGTRIAFKSVIAARAAALLAWTAAAAGDRIGGIVWNGATHHEVRPQSRQHGVLALLREMVSVAQEPGDGSGSLATPVRALLPTLRPGSKVVLISDFSTPSHLAPTDIAALSSRADVVLLQVVDRFETEAPPPGRYRVTDGNRSATLDLRSEASRHAYAHAFSEKRKALESLARQAKARLGILATHDDPRSAIALLAPRMAA